MLNKFIIIWLSNGDAINNYLPFTFFLYLTTLFFSILSPGSIPSLSFCQYKYDKAIKIVHPSYHYSYIREVIQNLHALYYNWQIYLATGLNIEVKKCLGGCLQRVLRIHWIEGRSKYELIIDNLCIFQITRVEIWTNCDSNLINLQDKLFMASLHIIICRSNNFKLQSSYYY